LEDIGVMVHGYREYVTLSAGSAKGLWA